MADLRRDVLRMEICLHPDDQNVRMKIVAPLVSLAEHMKGPAVDHIWACIAWQEMKPMEREPLAKVALEGENTKWASIVRYLERIDIEWILHDAITIWSMQAFDCIAELDRDRCPQKMGELYDRLNRVRSRVGVLVGVSDWVEIRRVYHEAIDEIDEYMSEMLEPTN